MENTNPTRGEKNRHAKLTPDSVLDIRRRRLAGQKVTALASQFAISASAVSQLCAGITWAHVPFESASPSVTP